MQQRTTCFLACMVIFFYVSALTACSGGGDKNDPPPQVSGTVIIGQGALGTVTAYALNPDGSNGDILGTAQTDNNGTFTIALSTAPTSGMRLVVADLNYFNPANTAASITGVSLSAIVPALSNSGIVITPLTTFADALMVNRLVAAGSVSTALTQADGIVKSIYGIQDSGTLTGLAPDFTAVSGDAAIYALVLGTLEQLAITNGKTLSEIINAIREDIADGLLDGKTVGGGAIHYSSVTEAPATLSYTQFLNAMDQYVAPGNSATILANNNVVLDAQIVTILKGAIDANSPAIQAAPPVGSLDTSFNSTGIVVTPLSAEVDFAKAIAIQADMKSVVAGAVVVVNTGAPVNTQFGLARYLADGSLDISFGSNGSVTTAIGENTSDAANAVAIQGDQKIVAAGYSYSNITNRNSFALVRYTSDGSLDTSFGIGGKVTTEIIGAFGSFGVVNSVAIQTDNKIVAVGQSALDTDSVFVLVRYNANGSLDTDFGAGGIVMTPSIDVGTSGNSNDVPNAIVIQSDNKIVAAGYSLSGAAYVFSLVRYNSDGSLDTSFDVDGKVITQIGTSTDYAIAVAIQADDKIVSVGGSYLGGSYNFALVRYNVDGSLDTSFGVGGKVTTDLDAGFDFDIAESVAIQSDGKIVAVGSASDRLTLNGVFALARYTTDGNLDTTFDTDGKVTTVIGSGAKDYAKAVVIQADGKILTAGSSSDGTSHDFALVRYVP